MASPLLQDLLRFLSSLEQAQQELLELFDKKSQALSKFQGDELIRLSEGERDLGLRLQALVSQRNRLLESAGKEGMIASSLTVLAGAIGDELRDALYQRIRAAEDRSARLRHESWIHWIISHRCYNHYTELLDLIAHNGHKAPTYNERAQGGAGVGGAILDASI